MDDSPIAPAIALSLVLAYPAFLFSLGRSGWRGIRGLTTLTHFGLRNGIVGRAYGVLYLGAVVALVGFGPVFLRYLTGLPLRTLLDSLRFPYSMYPFASLILVIGGIVRFPIARSGIRRKSAHGSSAQRSASTRNWANAYLYTIPTVFLGVGVLSAMRLPFFVLLGFVQIAVYLMTLAGVLGKVEGVDSGPA